MKDKKKRHRTYNNSEMKGYRENGKVSAIVALDLVEMCYLM